MDKTPTAPHRSTKRSPLAEIQPRTSSASVRSEALLHSKLASSARISRHESLRPEGNLSVTSKHNTASPRLANERVVAICEGEAECNKRDSQISTTSTLSTGRGKRKTHIGPWQLGRTLGKGATGRVRIARHTDTGKVAAVKIVSKKSAALVSSASVRQMDNDAKVSNNILGVKTMPFGIEREIVILKLIEHPNVISLYDIWENRGELYLVLEYVEGGELFDYIHRNGALPECEAARLLRQLLAGLAYCHRFNICHRDLKPENILLDANHDIKIADFGMAAMQPKDQHLTTACGSPHYAAPEILEGKHYRGEQCDIWSAGIILFAMLHGFLPFDGDSMEETLRLVRQGNYYLSPRLSIEATHLVQHMLQKSPKSRITMKEIWNHPFLSKHERIHASLAAPGTLPGPPPPLEPAECGPRTIRPEEIDRELLRHLQVLWHGPTERDMVQRLTSPAPNYEKLFYWALVKFHEEQLENYSAETMQYSASDHHHAKPPVLRLPKSSTKSILHQRRPSQFSIVSEGSITRAAYYKNPHVAASKTTQGSYDPYRASRTAITQARKQPTTVVVQTQPSQAASCLHAGARSRQGSYDGSALLRQGLDSHDADDLLSVLARKRATFSSYSSQSSLASSHPPRLFRKSISCRRNVSFQHQRRRSQRTADLSFASLCASTPRPGTRESHQTFSDSRSTPSIPTPGHIAQPKRPASDLDLHSTRLTHMRWRDDARKVSAELSKICEEAFNRSSVSYASDLTQAALVDSPATTVSPPDSAGLGRARSRVLTIAPVLQDLLDRRQRMIETWGSGNAETLEDLLETLDRRIVEEKRRAETVGEKRAASDPTNHTVRGDVETSSKPDTLRDLKRKRTQNVRSVTDPVRGQDRTIRMVRPESSSPLSNTIARSSKAMPINSLKGRSLAADGGRNSYDRRLLAGQPLDPILEDPSKSSRQHQVVEKKWSWLGRKMAGSSENLPPTPPRKDTPTDKQHTFVSNTSSTSVETTQSTRTVVETETSNQTWFQKVFVRRRKDKTLSLESDHTVVTEEEGFDSVEDVGLPSTRGPTRRGHRRKSSTDEVAVSSRASRHEVAQNLFAKILHLKPATSVLVMQVSKVRARKEIVKILRDWRKFGIRDVAVEKRPTGDVIRARVDATNYLHIRPVQLYASVYTVLERGKPANLSLVKFVQEKGAASSFHKVVDTMRSVLIETGCVLDSAEKRKKILKSMKQAGL